VISGNNISRDDVYIYCLVLAALFVGFRLISAMILVRKARRFY